MKRLLLSSLFFIGGIGISLGQCPLGSQYQGGTAPTPGNSVTMTTCAYAGEYQQVDGVVAGNDYVLTYTGGASNFVTIYDNTFTAVAWGVSPLSWTASGSGTFYSQPNLDDGLCGTDFSCHTGVWQNTSPPPPCPAEIAPWTEPFTTTIDPPCWTQSATTGGPWVYTGNPGYDVSGTLDHTNGVANNYAWMDFSSTDVGVILTTPEINVNALNVPELRFWEVSHYMSGSLGTYNLLYVEASDGLGGWTQVAVYQGETGAAWVEHTAILAPYIYTVGPDNFVQIRFRAESGGDPSDFYNDLLLDDVSVVEAPTCPQPINFQLDSADLTTASFSWTPTGSETEWYIEYGAPGFTPGTGTSVYVTPNPNHTIPGLTSNMFFEAYVRAYCTPGDTSFYTGPVAFNTYNQGIYMEADNECGVGFIDISGTGTGTGLTYGAEMDMPLGFDLVFQGTLVQNVTLSGTGAILLEAPLGSQVNTFNTTIAASPQGLYAFHDGLDASISGDVYYETIGTPGNQTFIVQWEETNYSFGPAGIETVTFQLQIEEATGEIYYIYEDVVFGGSDSFYDYGNSATIGVSGPNQDIQTSYNNQSYLQNNSCAHYYYTNCPIPTNFAVTYTTVDEGAVTWSAGLAGETNWTVIYGPAGFDPTQTGTTVQTGTPALIMPGLDDITTYDVYIYADCGPGTQSNGYMGSFTTLPNCADPTGIGAASAVDTIMSGWSWTENVGYPSTGFGIQYGFQGFAQGTGTTAWLDNNYTDTTADASLIGGGVYDIYIQAVCNTDSSNWVGPVSVTMPLSNDSTCFAEMLQVDGTEYTFDNTGATVDPGETGIAPPATGCQTQNGWCNSNINFTTWFTFVAPASGNVRVDCGGNSYDGQVAVYDVTDCADFATYTMLGANDDNGGNFSPEVSVCGLTPGNTYYIMFDSYSTFSGGVYKMQLDEIVVEAGTDNGLTDICLGDTIDLFTNISGYDAGGTWAQDIPTLGLNGSMFNSSGLASQQFGFTYVVIDGCASDTVATAVEVYSPSSAGTDGTIDACMNEPINLLSGLGGNVDLGGQWYDPSNSPTDSDITASTIPGQFNYDYISGNGVCPDDTANVIVVVDPGCDYLNLQELYFDGMDVYPNPTTGMIYISNNGSEEVYNIELTDLNGKVISTYNNAINGTETTEVSLEALETGFYLIRVFNDSAEKTFRVVKQ